MRTTRRVMRIVSPAPVLTMLGVGALTGCGSEDTAAERASLGVAQSAISVPDDVLAMTLAPLRQLETPGQVYFTSIRETFPGSGTFVHSVHIYQPDATGEPMSFELGATTSSGAVDASHTFEAVRLTTHPGEADESEQDLSDSSGQHVYTVASSQAGYYRLDFEYHAPNPGRTLSMRAVDAAGNPLKIAWCDPSGSNVQVSATLAAEAASDVFFKGGAYRRAMNGDWAYIDNVVLDDRLLYRRGFDQGPFDYPLGRLSAGQHTLRFSFTTSGTNPSYLWFGVNEDSFDTINAKTEWDRTQLLYRGSMHTGDYDAWNEGLAFAQGPALAHGVRPPPIRRGTEFAVALEDPGLNGPWANATLQIHPLDSSTPLGWPAWRSMAGDYRGGIMTASGFSARYREHWLVSVPADAPVGRYVLRATAPSGAQIGSDVLFYVIHNPYALVGGGLTKQEVETLAYDEDEDGMTLGGEYGPDGDSARDHFTALYSGDDASGYSVEQKLTAAFRRTHAADSYSMLDYALAAADGTTSEFESMRRLYRVVSQRVRYTRPAINGDSSDTFFGSGDGVDFSIEDARAAGQPGAELAYRVGGQCYDYSTILAALARASGIVSRVISAPSAGLGGWSPHYFTEAYIPDLPHHGGRTTPSGQLASDTDPWYVFDATDPKDTTTDWEFRPLWERLGEAISPRALYGRARIEIPNPQPTPWAVVTTRLDWDPLFDGTLTAGEVLPMVDAYASGPEYWLTESGVTGWIGYGEKDIYRISKEATGASAVSVRALPSGSAGLSPALCIASATAPAPAIPTQCADPGTSVELPPGESYVVVFNIEPDPPVPDLPDPTPSRLLRGDTMQYELVLETSCNESNAVDMGVPGTAITVPNDGCLKVTQYPAWWGTRQMQLQNMTPGTYPVPFSYTNCAATQGSGTITADWQSFFFNGISASCTTLIDLQGAGNGTVTIRYYAM
jgi:transglutaminase-like putative cysteine protease